MKLAIPSEAHVSMHACMWIGHEQSVGTIVIMLGRPQSDSRTSWRGNTVELSIVPFPLALLYLEGSAATTTATAIASVATAVVVRAATPVSQIGVSACR